MVGVAPDEGGGRRLPQWMLGIRGADQVEKSDNVEAKKKNLEDRLSSQASNSDSTSKKKGLREKENVLERSHVLAKCKTKRKKLKDKTIDADSDTNVCEDVPEKQCKRTERKVSDSTSRKRGKTKDCSSEELDIQPLSEDEDVDLTVEDLMTIAKEYVEGDKNMEQDQASKRKLEHRSRSLTTVSSRNELIDRNDARICNQTTASDDISASYNKTKADHRINAFHKSESSSTEEIVININRTGDPAHDMLDLFLGPLLRKPVDEKKTDFAIRDVELSEQLGIQSKTNIVREEKAPSMKKKSSLKDKVSMFLD